MVNRSREFTTYVNIKPGQDNRKNLAQMERQAKDSLTRIARISQSATAQSRGQVGGRTSPGSVQAMAAAQRAQAQAIQRTTAAQAANAVATARSNAVGARQVGTTRRATREVNRLERALRSASIAANVAQGPLGPIAGRISAIGNAVGQLSGIQLGFIGAGAGIAAFGRMASTAEDLKSQLRPLFESQQDVNMAWRESIRIADQAKVSIRPVVDLYSRLTLAGRDAGLQINEITQLTEIASKAARLSGGTATSQEAGLFQFAQGIGSQELQGDELRSVRENTLRLAKAIADGLDVPLAKLKELGAEGELTPRVIADALISQSDRIDEELSRLPPTITTSTTALSNAFTAYISESNEATGVTTAFATVVNGLAENLNFIATGLLNAGIAWGSYRAAVAATNISRTTSQLIAQRAEVRKVAIAQQQASQQQRRNSAQAIQQYRSERTALASRIQQERQFLQASLKTARELRNRVTPGQGFVAGNPGEVRQYRVALDRVRVAQDNLSASKNRLRTVGGQLSTQMGILTTHSRRYRTATSRAQAASFSFAGAARNLLAQINPLGIAIAILIPLLIQLAFRKDRAAEASDRMAVAEAELTKFIDQTTGVLREQNAALIENQILKQRTNREDALADRRRLRRRAQGLVDGRDEGGFGGYAGIGNVSETLVDPRVRAILGSLSNDNSQTTSAAITRQLRALDGLDERSQRTADRAIELLALSQGSAREAEQARAATALLQGQGTEEDRRRAFGNFTGEDVEFTSPTPTPTASPSSGRKGRSQADIDEQRRREEERRLERVERLTDRRADTLAKYDEQSSALDRALRDARELDQVVGQTMNGLAAITEDNPLGEGIYTQAMADADRERIFYGLREPIRAAIEEEQQRTELLTLRADGYALEADALEQALQIQERIGEVTNDELAQLIEERRYQEEINDQLAQRERVMGQILDVAQNARQETEDLIVNFRRNPADAIKNFANNLIDNAARIQARQLTERLFAGADAKLRELVDGKNGVERATEILRQQAEDAADSHGEAADGATRLATATDRAAVSITDAAQRIASGTIADPIAVGAQGIVSGDQTTDELNEVTRAVSAITSAVTGGSIFAIAASAIKSSGALSSVQGLQEGTSSGDNEIVVTGDRRSDRPPSAQEAFNSVFEEVGAGLDSIFKSGTFFEGIGGAVGGALQGAAQGQLAGGVLDLIGLPSSSTGSAIGGAIGSFLPIPGGGFIGGAVGGLLGGLFGGTPRGSSSIGGVGGELGLTGFSGKSARRDSSNSLAGTVIERVNQIAERLGATVDASRGSVSIGTRKNDFRVDPTGRGNTKTSRGAVDFGDDEEAAIAFAVRDLITDGVITGISQASQNILRAGGDLETALTKAFAIEAIPDRLLEIQDPARFAVQQLNEEFERLIGYLKEGGATAAQFAEAQELYDLERARAIEEATNQTVDVIQSYLDEITGGSSSPLNRRDTFNNASSQLDEFREAIANGEDYDVNELLVAARNFQDASRALNGAGAGFFEDYNDVIQLLEQARDGSAGAVTGVDDLPASPFETDAQVAALLGANNDAINDQTGVLSGLLADILASLGGTGSGSLLPNSSLGILPGFGGGGRLDYGSTLNLV